MADPSCTGADGINCFALVTYIPGPLGSFLDELRCELEPQSLAPRAHVTVLPPRGLLCQTESSQAWAQLETELPKFQSFEVGLGAVEIFDKTNVVYLAVAHGGAELHAMHTRLSGGRLKWDEQFPYHPHITIAQKIDPQQAIEIRDAAQDRWNRYRGPRSFFAETFTFVQNNSKDRWRDLAEITLPSHIGVR